MKKFIIEDKIEGTITYKYEIEANTEEEARILFVEGDQGIDIGSEFEPDDNGRTSIIVSKKEE